jgi:tRNA (cytidine/uridine-2'-O-)-methyltransferase
MFHVVLVNPEIPPNTGNIIRLCANTGCTLHLVKPIGFDISLKAVRRAGLDYDALAEVRTHVDIAECFHALGGARAFVIETTGERIYSDERFAAGDALIFGPEHRGLTSAVLDRIPRERHLSIPMRPANRSLNLSNSVALVVYEAWRQNGFAGGVLATARARETGP